MKVAALDLGTNTFICLLAEGEQGRIHKVEKDLVEIVRLGQDVQNTGSLHPEALLRAEQCLARFQKEIKAFAADKVIAVATSAARDAKNGHLLFELGTKYQIPIQIITGDDEAKVSFLGATFDLPKSKESVVVIDIGGGSTELIVGALQAQEDLKFAKSLDIGAVRATEKLIPQQPVPIINEENLNKYIQTQLGSSLDKIKSLKVSRAIAVGGMPTSLAALELGGFDETKVNGYFLSLESLRNWKAIFTKTTIHEKELQYHLGKRSDIIFAGTSILLHVIQSLNLPGVFVSTKGVRYGVALKALA